MFKTSLRNALSILAISLILAACGGGGVSSPTPTPTPTIYHQNSFSSAVVNQIVQVPVIFPIQPALLGSTPLNSSFDYRRYYNFGINGSAHGDMRHTGLDDIIFTPSTAPLTQPYKMEFWVNNGDGTFTNKAEQLIVGGAPTLIFGPTVIADFNGDGTPDILHMDSPEYGQCVAPSENPFVCTSGGKMTYLQSQSDGTWVDRSNQLPPTFNTDSVVSVGSSNGDGVMDVIYSANGLHFFKNDGKGNFTEQTDRFPLEIRGFASGNAQGDATQYVAQSSFGAATFAKVSGQSKPVLVTGSYGVDWGTQLTGTAPGSSGTNSIRFFTQKSDGSYINAQTLVMNKLDSKGGVCPVLQIKSADVTKSGTDDVFVLFDIGDSNCSPMLLRNSGIAGAIHYSDVAQTAIPDIKKALYFPQWQDMSSNDFYFVDADGDGNLDIILTTPYTGGKELLQRVPFLYGDGKGNFAVKSLEFDNITPTTSTVGTSVGVADYMFEHWVGTCIPLRLQPNKPYGMLIVETGRDGDQTVSPYKVDKQIRLHSFFPSGSR